MMTEYYESLKKEWVREETINKHGEMMLKPFVEEVIGLQKEVLCNGENSIASHKLQSSVIVQIFNPTTGHITYGSVKWVEPSTMMGCGCWDGIKIIAEEDL
jgi:hypothetical protein